MDIIGIVCAPLAGYGHAGHRPTAEGPSVTYVHVHVSSSDQVLREGGSAGVAEVTEARDRMLHVSDDPGETLFSPPLKPLMGSHH